MSLNSEQLMICQEEYILHGKMGFQRRTDISRAVMELYFLVMCFGQFFVGAVEGSATDLT